MLRILHLAIVALLIPSLCFGAVSNLKEEDGSPDIYPWQLRVQNGSLTDNGDGTASLNIPAPDLSSYLTSATAASTYAPITEPLSLHLNGSNANTDIDIGTYDFTTTGTMKAGNVGIGTSTPSQILDINGTMKYDKDNADLQLDYGSITFSQVTPPSTVCTATDLGVSDGNITASNIRYKITYITNVGETNQTLESDVVAGPLVNGKIKLTNIPVSDNPVVTGRKIYRRDTTQGGPSGYYSVYVGTINDNTTTEWVDNVANPGYAVGAIKSINTAGGGMFGLAELNVGNPGKAGYINIYNDDGIGTFASGFINFYDQANPDNYLYQFLIDYTKRFSLSSAYGQDCTLLLNGNGNTTTSIAFVGAGSRGSYTAKGDYNHYIAPNAGFGAGHLIFQSTGGTGNFKLLADNSKAMFGAASDASIYYDGADMIFDSREVGRGDFIFKNGEINQGSSGIGRINIGGGTANKSVSMYTDNTNAYIQSWSSTPLYFQKAGGGNIYFGKQVHFNGGVGDLGTKVNFGGGSSGEAGALVYTKTATGASLQSYGSKPIILNSSGNNVALRADNNKLLLGAGDDASIYYDGTNLNINPKAVGSGYLNIKGQTLVDDKIMFTQTDGNEYIDSLADGYMDYGATTAHRFSGPVHAVHKAADGTAAVADGTYTVGIGTTTNGTITIKDGIITAIQEAT